MKNTTKQMSADACVLSVRTRPAGRITLADTRVEQGITLPIATSVSVSMALVTTAAPFAGVVSGVTFAYKSSDVVHSPSGRPPV